MVAIGRPGNPRPDGLTNIEFRTPSFVKGFPPSESRRAGGGRRSHDLSLTRRLSPSSLGTLYQAELRRPEFGLASMGNKGLTSFTSRGRDTSGQFRCCRAGTVRLLLGSLHPGVWCSQRESLHLPGTRRFLRAQATSWLTVSRFRGRPLRSLCSLGEPRVSASRRTAVAP